MKAEEINEVALDNLTGVVKEHKLSEIQALTFASLQLLVLLRSNKSMKTRGKIWNAIKTDIDEDVVLTDEQFKEKYYERVSN